MIRILDVLHTAAGTHAERASAERALLGAVTRDPRRGYLRTFALSGGDGLLLGRYHAVPRDLGAVTSPDDICVQRRRTGGRVMPAGEGFLELSLVLPHRAALLSDDWHALEPEQVMNRCVRGVLQGLKGAGVPAFYPGRDTITAADRTLGAASFHTTPEGALLFEVVIAMTRSFAVVPPRLDAVDPTGVIACPMWTATDTTTVEDIAPRAVAANELSNRIVAGYRDLFALDIVPGQPGGQCVAGGGLAESGADRQWLYSRSPGAALTRRGTVSTQIGVLEAYVDREGDRLREVMLVGDFIANAAAVDALEAKLRGAHMDRAGISATVFGIFSQPGNFMLGLTNLTQIADAIGDAR